MKLITAASLLLGFSNLATTQAKSNVFKSTASKIEKSHVPASAVYTMTNSGENNEIAVYKRDLYTGTLEFMQTVSTGGFGGR